MRIVLAGQTFYKKSNGQAVFTINLAEGLAQAGHQVLVLCPTESSRPTRTVHHNLTIQTVPTLPLGHNVNITALARRIVNAAVADMQPDVIHLQDHYFLSRTVLRVTPAPHIVRIGTNHFLPENLTDNLGVPASIKPYLHKILWQSMLQVFNRLHFVTTPTTTAVEILRRQKLVVPLQAISCGVDRRRFKPRPYLDPDRIRQRYGLDTARTTLLYVGRIDREKGLACLVKAIAALPTANIQLALVGRGTFMKGLQALSRQLALSNRIIFAGYVSNQDLPLLFNSADIFVMPSQAELQSIATLEAMSSGLPVLAANARALPELIKNGINGYLFDPNNPDHLVSQLNEMVSSPRLWPIMGHRNLALAGEHSLPQTISHYVNLYADLQQAQRKVSAGFRSGSDYAGPFPAYSLTSHNSGFGQLFDRIKFAISRLRG